jgi:hypothetical protein
VTGVGYVDVLTDGTGLGKLDDMVAVRQREPTEIVEPTRRWTWTRLVAIALAIAPPLTQLAVLVVKGRDEWAFLFTDDAYYYFGVARNIASGEGSTFTGLVETNGYHPLWMVALSAVGLVLRGTYTFLIGVAVLQTVLWIGAVREAILIGRRLGSEALGVAGMVALGFLGVITGQLAFNGMESAPLLFLLLLTVRLTLEVDEEDPRALRRLGVVLALVCLTRLDATATAVALAAVVAFRGRPAWSVLRTRAVLLLGPAGAALVVYAVLNQLVFGSPTPVSGRAKSLGAPFWNEHPLDQFLKAGQYSGRPLWLGVATLVMLAVALLLRDWRTTAAGRRLAACAGALLVGQAVLLVYLTVATSYRIWAWYHYNLAILAFCAAALLAQSLSVRRGAIAAPVCLVLGAAFVVAQVPATFDSGVNHSHRAIELVEFIEDELPDDAVLAMGDRAGFVGYLADRPMLQTEGLMADTDWLHDLAEGTAPARMAEEGVDYFLWSGVLSGRSVETADGVPCLVLDEPRAGDGPSFEVTVCWDDLVFHTGTGHDQFNVFRYRQRASS